MVDNDRTVALMKERAELKREECCLRKEFRDASSSFSQNERYIKQLLEGFPPPDQTRFALYPSYKELSEKVKRLAEIEERVKKIQDCVPELKV